MARSIISIQSIVDSCKEELFMGTNKLVTWITLNVLTTFQVSYVQNVLYDLSQLTIAALTPPFRCIIILYQFSLLLLCG